MRNIRKIIILNFLLFILAISCASHEPETVVKKNIKEETITAVPPTDVSRIETAIDANKELTREQKEKLVEIVHNVRDKNTTYKEEINRYRKVLLNEILDENDSDRVSILKDKISSTENLRVENYLGGVDQFEEVLKDSAAKKEMMKRAMEMDVSSLDAGPRR